MNRLNSDINVKRLDFDINVKGLNFDINEIFFADCIILCTSLALLVVYLISFERLSNHNRTAIEHYRNLNVL
jgi:hypothetical protein